MKGFTEVLTHTPKPLLKFSLIDQVKIKDSMERMSRGIELIGKEGYYTTEGLTNGVKRGISLDF